MTSHTISVSLPILRNIRFSDVDVRPRGDLLEQEAERAMPAHIQKFSAKRLEFPVDMAAATGPTSLPLTRR
jgi:hypothetical protein